MNDETDDYLFDGTGEPDPEVVALERALAPFRHRDRPLALPDTAPAAEHRSHPEKARVTPARRDLDAAAPRRVARRPLAPVAAMAALLAALFVAFVGGAAWLAFGGRDSSPRGPSYRLEPLAGQPSVTGEHSTSDGEFGTGLLRSGDAVECGPDARARLHVGDIGSVELEPGSRLAVRDAGDLPRTADGAYLLYLERGGMRARINAAPRTFQVGTPAGLAVDLGCVYAAHVADDGTTLLTVELGVVAFESLARRVVVPMGAFTRAYPGRGPGTPVWSDSPEEFLRAVRGLDERSGNGAELLELVLASESERDSLTLWHLLDLDDSGLRARVYDRLAVLAPPPEGVTRDGVLAGDEAMRALWRRALSWDQGIF